MGGYWRPRAGATVAGVLAAIAGGVGAARMLRGLAAVVPPAEITAIVNTADDFRLHGLAISPDLDTVTYTLADASNQALGWGLDGETWKVMEQLERLGGETWFRLGDRDLATHLYRTQRLASGASLSDVAAELALAWGLQTRLLPMTDSPVETRLVVGGQGETDDEDEIGFQDYFVARRHSVPVRSVRFAGVSDSVPGPDVLAALADAERVVICPSNPIVSVGPVLAVPGIRDAVAARRPDVVAVSPIIAGAAIKGPADRLMRELGHESTVVGVARLYADVAGTLVIDSADAALAPAVEDVGLRCLVAPTVMSSPDAAAALARVIVSC
ncbi:MAG: 2-phospho-L-lactate transferase [Acidimicrobiaceae bacterium]|nr:2-phospho-L-lactate transferase [Acidimicrobiaceae bacterium]